MLRKLIGTMVVMLVAIGFVTAEDWTGVITKVDGNKITFQKTKKVNKKAENDGDAVTLEAAKDVKVNKGMAKKGQIEVGDAIEGGLKNEMFSKIGGKGLPARVTTSDDNKSITAVVVTAPKKKAAQ
jgi:hypothetical protein